MDNKQVTYHRISNDDKLEGSFVNCENCDRELVRYIKIGGQIFGMNCGANILDITKSRLTGDHSSMIRAERARAQQERYRLKRT